MKRLLKLPIFFALISLFSLCLFASAATTPNILGYFNGNLGSGVPVYDGPAGESGSIGNGSCDGLSVVTLTPGNSSEESCGFLHSSVEKLGIAFQNVKYIRYYYYIESSANINGRAKLFIPESEFNLADDCTVYSFEEIEVGKWAYFTFDVNQALFGEILPGGILPEFELYPFGDTVDSKLPNGTRIHMFSMYLLGSESNLALSAISSGNLVQKYPVYFESGRIDVEGEREFTFAEIGETITLPECPFTRKDYKFIGWICSDGAEIYQPGDEYTVVSRGVNGGAFVTARTDFTAEWVRIEEEESDKPYDAVSYSKYWGGLVKPAQQQWHYDYATVQHDYIFDNATTMRLIFNPKSAYANQVVNLDGYSWANYPLSVSKYKYLIIPYYFKSERKTEELPFDKPVFTFLTSGGNKTLAKSYACESKLSLVSNQWSFMLFEFDFYGELKEYLNPNRVNDNINQCHFRPFGTTAAGKANNLLEGDELYFGNFVFLNEIPVENPTLLYSFADGYEDGTFMPGANLSNAEAAAMLAKAIGLPAEDADSANTLYSDLDGEEYDWCRGYIYGLERRGILTPSKGERFLPDEDASESRFVKAIIGARSGNTGAETVGKFSDGVSKLTRERAVASIFTILRDSTRILKLPENVYSVFYDVDSSNALYNEIAMASYSVIKYKNKLGEERYINSLFVEESSEAYGVNADMIEEGEAYLAQLDKVVERRIAEIRATESVYKQKPGGKTVYLSSTEGSTSSSGTDSYNPKRINTLDEINRISLSAGDVVLFKRGDTFRGKFTTVSGVTYSAYGEGPKPILMRSPEDGADKSKWILFHSDEKTGAKIWKYHREDFVDVGAINLIDASGHHTVAYKEVPDFREDTFFVRGKKPPNKVYNVNEGEPFDIKIHLDRDLEFFHKADSVLANCYHTGFAQNEKAPELGTATGPLYLRCDSGNPGEIYSRIEFNLRANLIGVGGSVGVTVDNLCLMYFGSHGVGAGNTNNLVVTNCEVGYGGGAIQHYNPGTGSAGHVTRFGNGIEIYGGLVNYTIDNCYVYEIYDAGITHQISGTSDGSYYMQDVYYTNNVIEKCIYNIEYFMTRNTVKDKNGDIPLHERYLKNVFFTGNICRMAGYGWGVQRPDGNVPSNIRGWGTNNHAHNYVIEDNIFDRTADFKSKFNDATSYTGSQFESSTPYLKNNIFIQPPGRLLLGYGTKTYRCTADSERDLRNFGGVGNKVYFVHDDIDEYRYSVIW